MTIVNEGQLYQLQYADGSMEDAIKMEKYCRISRQEVTYRMSFVIYLVRMLNQRHRIIFERGC